MTARIDMSIFKNIEDYADYLRDLDDHKLVGIARRIDKDKFPERYQMVCEYLNGNRDFIPEPIPETRGGKEEKEKIIHRPIPKAPPVPKTYAGFGSRVLASIIDFIIYLPVFAIYWWLSASSRNLAIISSIIYISFFFFYTVYLHGRFGQTVGKMATKIKVVQMDGSPATYFVAFKRHAVDNSLLTISMLATVIATFSISSELFELLPSQERQVLINQAYPIWGLIATVAGIFWAWSEIIVLLTNRKRRALHDFIAGTVVIHNEFEEKLSNKKMKTVGK